MTSKTETEVVFLDASTLEVRYYDDGRPGKYRCWKIPTHEARDIVRWWSECGAQLKSGGDAEEKGRFGSVVIGLLSATLIYVRGCDQLGRPAITGYQLPRDAVAILHDWLAERDLAMVATSDLVGE